MTISRRFVLSSDTGSAEYRCHGADPSAILRRNNGLTREDELNQRIAHCLRTAKKLMELKHGSPAIGRYNEELGTFSVVCLGSVTHCYS